MITATWDTKRGRDALNSLHDAMVGRGMDVSGIVEGDAMQLAIQIANFMPPLGPGGKSAGARKAGESAITREIENLISEAKPALFDELGSKFGISHIDTWRAKPGGEKLHLLFDHLAVQQGALHGLHKAYRDKDGKIPLEKPQRGIWHSRILVQEGDRDTYLKVLIDRVGRLKATWAWTAASLGAKRLPRWVTRHFGKLGGQAIFDGSKLKDPKRPFVIFGSRAPGTRRPETKVKQAMTSRARILKIQVQRILAGHATNIARGQLCTPLAKRMKKPEPTIEE